MVKSRVVILRSATKTPARVEERRPLFGRMLAAGLEQLNKGGIASRFHKRDTMGLKVNCLAGKNLSTDPALAYGAADLLRNSGLDEKNIIIWDRQSRELEDCGFTLNFASKGIRCFGTDANGAGYEEELSMKSNIGSLLSRILTRTCTAQVNLPVLKDHNLSGISASMKNWYGAINNPNKYHDDNCNPYIAELNSLPEIRGKCRLIIVDATRIQYNGGPAFKEQWNEPYNGVIIGSDPVAVDSVCWSIVEEIRRKHKLPTLKAAGREPTYIKTAGEMGLGNSDMKNIEVKEISV
jgi:uncharacterized protein (DUF362 family)